MTLLTFILLGILFLQGVFAEPARPRVKFMKELTMPNASTVTVTQPHSTVFLTVTTSVTEPVWKTTTVHVTHHHPHYTNTSSITEPTNVWSSMATPTPTTPLFAPNDTIVSTLLPEQYQEIVFDQDNDIEELIDGTNARYIEWDQQDGTLYAIVVDEEAEGDVALGENSTFYAIEEVDMEHSSAVVPTTTEAVVTETSSTETPYTSYNSTLSSTSAVEVYNPYIEEKEYTDADLEFLMGNTGSSLSRSGTMALMSALVFVTTLLFL